MPKSRQVVMDDSGVQRKSKSGVGVRAAALVLLAALMAGVCAVGVSHLNAPDAQAAPEVVETEEPEAAEAVETEEPEALEAVETETPEASQAVETETEPEERRTRESWVSQLLHPKSKAQKILDEMTLREKVFQLFIVFPDQLTKSGGTVTESGEEVRDGLERYPVGGVIFDRENLRDREQVRAMLDAMQAFSKTPLIMTCDEEGGRVNRLMSTVGTTYVGPMLSYRDKGVETARNNAITIAGGLLSCGFNMDLAPVADVWSNPENSVIGNRAYSTEFGEAAKLVAAAVEGFHEGGVACTLKHFPGHGNTYEDSHTGSARVYRTLAELEEGELRPFRAGIAAGADAVMIGHLIAGEIDANPATVSHAIVTDLLRGELGFQGVVMTDSLQMEAVTKHYDAGEAAVKALEAGVDVLLCPANLRAAADAVLSAVDGGRVSETRVNESVLRILELKEKYGILH